MGSISMKNANSANRPADIKDFTSSLIGGPQRRGRSPMMKDQNKSTWWMQGEQREHFARWMQANKIHAAKVNNNKEDS